MFDDNKYTRWYYSIIKNYVLFARGGEVHHIIPRSLGGADDAENLVRLSYRAHFVVHKLLPFMVKTDKQKGKMYAALWYMMNRKGRHKYTARYYSEIKEKYIANHPNKSDVFRAKISKAHKGKKLSAETKRKISEGRKGKKNPHTEETKRKMSESKKGKKFSEAHRAAMREAHKRRPPPSEETKAKISASVKKNHPHRGKPMSEEQKAKIRAVWARRRENAVRAARAAGSGYQADLFEAKSND